MNRRGFLKLCGIAIAVPGLPAAIKPRENPYLPQDYKDRIEAYRVPKQFQWPDKFDPTKGCSHGVRHNGLCDPGVQEKAKALLVKSMESYVPPVYRKYVTFHRKMFNWGRTVGITWSSEPPNRRSA